MVLFVKNKPERVQLSSVEPSVQPDSMQALTRKTWLGEVGRGGAWHTVGERCQQPALCPGPVTAPHDHPWVWVGSGGEVVSRSVSGHPRASKRSNPFTGCAEQHSESSSTDVFSNALESLFTSRKEASMLSCASPGGRAQEAGKHFYSFFSLSSCELFIGLH